MLRNIEDYKERRRRNFYRWWKRNDRRVVSHEWLVRTARTYAYTYSYHSNVFSLIQEISKRFQGSQYKRLRMDDAWFLCKHVNLLPTERVELLKQSGDYYKSQRDQKKAEKKAEKKPLVVHKKTPKLLKKT